MKNPAFTRKRVDFVGWTLLLYIVVPLTMLILNNGGSTGFSGSGTLIGFCLFTGQFFWSPGNRYVERHLAKQEVRTLHARLGYICLGFFSILPLLSIAAKVAVSDLSAPEYFVSLVNNDMLFGYLPGFIGWLTLLGLGVSTLLRKKLRLSKSGWQTLHGWLALLTILSLGWYAVETTRQVNAPISLLLFFLVGRGILHYLTGDTLATLHHHR